MEADWVETLREKTKQPLEGLWVKNKQPVQRPCDLCEEQGTVAEEPSRAFLEDPGWGRGEFLFILYAVGPAGGWDSLSFSGWQLSVPTSWWPLPWTARKAEEICWISAHLTLCSLVAQMVICLQHGRPGFDSWVGKILWRREWLSTPVFLPGESHRQRSLVGYSLPGLNQLDRTERLTLWNNIALKMRHCCVHHWERKQTSH